LKGLGKQGKKEKKSPKEGNLKTKTDRQKKTFVFRKRESNIKKRARKREKKEGGT